jgi:hypothetical protein
MRELERIMREQRGVVLAAQLEALAQDRAHLRRLKRKLRPLLRGAWGAGDDLDPLLVHRAALQLLPGLVFRGLTSLSLQGVAVEAPDLLQVYVDQSADASDRPELDLSRTGLAELDVIWIEGLPLVSAARAAVDLACALSRPDGLAVLDAALHAGVVTRAELEGAVRFRARGVVQARALIALADGRAESPPESWVRLYLHDGGVIAPVPQYEVRSEHGRLVGRLDLAWPAVKLYLEYDGRVAHSGDLAFHRDRRRQNELLALGWVCLRITSQDLRSPRALANRVAAELRRLGHPAAA